MLAVHTYWQGSLQKKSLTFKVICYRSRTVSVPQMWWTVQLKRVWSSFKSPTPKSLKPLLSPRPRPVPQRETGRKTVRSEKRKTEPGRKTKSSSSLKIIRGKFALAYYYSWIFDRRIRKSIRATWNSVYLKNDQLPHGKHEMKYGRLYLNACYHYMPLAVALTSLARMS